ncbi:MAG: hypothetical protein LRY37_06065, partial [Alkalibacterium thalassium]|nr:hypothetical protein [Alkalibacterium thalassium]
GYYIRTTPSPLPEHIIAIISRRSSNIKRRELKEKCHELLMNTQKEQAKGLYVSLDYHPLDFI